MQPQVASGSKTYAMNILFIHTNFPAQYRHLANRLRREPGVQMTAIGSVTARPVEGVRLVRYPAFDGDVSLTHPFARRFDLECRRAEQVLYALSSLRAGGFVPDVILGHPGWGECLPVRTIFPKAKLFVYCEFFYGVEGRDVGFDPEFPATGVDGHVGLHLKNATTLLALADCDRGISPTLWQKSTYPETFQDRIDVVHEGIDVDVVAPRLDAAFPLRDGRRLTRSDEVLTFVARNLEPLRGYHVFMRALPRILAARPHAQVLIIGGDGTSYGAAPPAGRRGVSGFWLKSPAGSTCAAFISPDICRTSSIWRRCGCRRPTSISPIRSSCPGRWSRP